MEFERLQFGACRVMLADVTPLLDEGVFQKLLPTVSSERQETALRYKFAKGRALSLGAALALDRLLQDRGLRERDQHYLQGAHGKPSLAAHPEIHFNLSHTSHFVACAVADVEIGIDIQHVVNVGDAVMQRVLSAAELQAVEQQSDERSRNELFARLWALKESYVKAVGTGITDDFPAFSLAGDAPRLVNRTGNFRFHEFEFSDGKGALCMVNDLI